LPSIETLFLFTGIAFLFGASPGPNFIFVLSRSIIYGTQNGIITTLGIGSGGLIYTLCAVLGVSALLATSELAFSIIKYLGASYLIYLGIAVFLDKNYAKSFTKNDTQKSSIKKMKAYRQGFITTMLNPKAGLYYISFIPQFIDTSLKNSELQLLILGTIQSLAAVIVYTFVALFAGKIGTLIKHNATFRKTQQILTGTTFILLGISVTY
jgi:threonine/homoserine/homoserine lactone efflux protein